MNIAHKGQKIGILIHEKRLVTVLKDVADAAPSRIHSLRMAKQKSLHEPAQRTLPGADDQM
ncbi:MAG: hypothetical protein AAB368_04490 [bacterium]